MERGINIMATVGQLYRANKDITLTNRKVNKDDICVVELNIERNRLVLIAKNQEEICDVGSIFFKMHFELITEN